MARFLAQTLTRDTQTLTLIRSLSLSPSVLSHRRAKSDRPAKLIEIDLGSESEPEGEHRGGGRGGDREEIEIHFGIKKLEDAIHSIIVRKSAPDWLPFIPGSSYWVPPMVQLFGQSAATAEGAVFETMTALVKEESPSFPYFVEGALPRQIALPLSVKKGTSRFVKRRRSKKAALKSDDEED